MKLSTKNIHVGVKVADPTYGSVVPPIYPTSTYSFPTANEGALRFSGKKKGMIYSRFTNPTVDALQMRLAELEEAEAALATGSGMGAITCTLFHFLKSGDSIVAHKALYGGTYELISHMLPRYGITPRIVDFNNLEELEKNIDETTKILYFESPTNPMIEIIDIQKIVELAKQKNILTVFDNTFAPPPLQYAYKKGIDIVIHSLTKYINGHSDITGGAIIGSKKYIDEIFAKSYIFFGPTLSPFAAYLVMRGMETLEVRIKKQCDSTDKIIEFLSSHPKISVIHYPGLPTNPYHERYKKQMSHPGSVFSFEVKGGYEAAEKLVNSVQLIHLAVSLGAVESLIEHPASMTHSELTPEERKKAGINDALIRLSVGLEDVEDLIHDLTQSLDSI